MSKKTLYAVTALFDTPDAIMHAAAETSKAGYTRFDVNTPYPLHGMDKAMRLKSSKMGYWAFVFGTMGAALGIGFISWVALEGYALVLGGKPYWSWPAFVPVTFEVTVLLASVLSTVTMIVFYFKFPNNAHPLHDTPYMKAVSSDRFGLCILAMDPKFDESDAKNFLKRLGGREVGPVYYDDTEIAHGQKLFDLKFLGVLAVTALVVSTATYVTLNHLLYLPPFDWMVVQEKLKPQKPSELFTNGIGMRPPVEGTVARGFLPYPFSGKPDDAGKYLVNPLLPTRDVIERGHQRFLTFCSPCHGNFGRGDSRLQGQFPTPPTLHSDKVRSWPDGSIYNVLTEGQNVMPGYASQISRDDRWAIIHYIRVLQRAQHAKESDLK